MSAADITTTNSLYFFKIKKSIETSMPFIYSRIIPVITLLFQCIFKHDFFHEQEILGIVYIKTIKAVHSFIFCYYYYSCSGKSQEITKDLVYTQRCAKLAFEPSCLIRHSSEKVSQR